MAAPLRDLDDGSDLDGELIEIGPRIAWLLRMARLGSAAAQHGGAPTQAEMVTLLARSGYSVNPTLLSRVESGAKRIGVVTDGYEDVLGLEPGSLRAPIDILCRTFPFAPPDLSPDRLHRRDCTGHDAVAVIEAVTRTSGRVDRADCVGGDWLAWARSLACPRAAGFPGWLLEPWLDRLVSELARSVGTAFATRYEALALLRCGPYGEFVLGAAQRWIADPDVQALYDVMSAVSEHPEPRVLAWSCSLLVDPRPHVVHGAVLALENMLQVGGLDPSDWDRALDDILGAYAAAPPHTDVHASLSKILAALPPAQRVRAVAGCKERGLMPLVRPHRLSSKGPKEPGNEQWAAAQQIAAGIAAECGVERQPILERLLFEVIFEHRETRVVTSMFMLSALPFTAVISRHLMTYARTQAPEEERAGVLERLMMLLNGEPLSDDTDWPAAGDVAALAAFLALRAQAGQPVADEHLEVLLDAGGAYRRRALYAAGLTGSDLLTDLAGASSGRADLRGPATWWLTQGRLVDDRRR